MSEADVMRALVGKHLKGKHDQKDHGNRLRRMTGGVSAKKRREILQEVQGEDYEATFNNVVDWLQKIPSKSNVEHGFWVDDDGKVVDYSIGLEKSVAIPKAQLQGKIRGLTTIHSHPGLDLGGKTLSAADVASGWLYGAKKVVAVHKDGYAMATYPADVSPEEAQRQAWYALQRKSMFSYTLDDVLAGPKDGPKRFVARLHSEWRYYAKRVAPEGFSYKTVHKPAKRTQEDKVVEIQAQIDFNERVIEALKPVGKNDVLERMVAKHKGPGNHPDGSPQKVHGKKGLGRSSGSGPTSPVDFMRDLGFRNDDKWSRAEKVALSVGVTAAYALAVVGMIQYGDKAMARLKADGISLVDDIPYGQGANAAETVASMTDAHATAIAKSLRRSNLRLDHSLSDRDLIQSVAGQYEGVFGGLNTSVTSISHHGSLLGVGGLIKKEGVDAASAASLAAAKEAMEGHGDMSIGDAFEQIQAANGGSFERYINLEDLKVDHSFMSIPNHWQGNGFADGFNGKMFGVYKTWGLKRVTVHANIDVGGYTWAAQGFDFVREADRGMGQDLEFRLETTYDNLKGATALNALNPDVDPNAVAYAKTVNAQLKDLVDRSKLSPTHRNYPSVQEIAALGREKTWTNQRGFTMWVGKQILLGSGWYGEKKL